MSNEQREAAWQEYKRENTIPGYDRPSREEFMFGWQRALEATAYPRNEDPFIVLGPEIFTDRSGDVLCWKGENYVRQTLPTPPVAGEPERKALEPDFRLARSRGYRTLAAERDFTGHMESGRRTAYYEGFKVGRDYPTVSPAEPELRWVETQCHQPGEIFWTNCAASNCQNAKRTRTVTEWQDSPPSAHSSPVDASGAESDTTGATEATEATGDAQDVRGNG